MARTEIVDCNHFSSRHCADWKAVSVSQPASDMGEHRHFASVLVKPVDAPSVLFQRQVATIVLDPHGLRPQWYFGGIVPVD